MNPAKNQGRTDSGAPEGYAVHATLMASVLLSGYKPCKSGSLRFSQFSGCWL